MIIWPVSKHGVMGAEGPQRRDVATPASSSQGKKKKKILVLFRLKGGKEAVAEAGGRVAEGNRASRGVSVLDKQIWALRGQQPLAGELFAFQNEDGAPPGQEEPPEPSCAWH